MKELIPDNVKEDPELSQEEKESNMWWDKTTDDAYVFTSERGLMRRLLQHPLFEVTSYDEKDGKIVCLKGKFPIAAISLGSSERKQKGHAQMVTNGVLNVEDNAKISI